MHRLALIAVLLAGCARPPPRRAEPPPPPPAAARGIAARPLACPIDVPRTRLEVEDTDRGAAMVFVTETDPLDLRVQVFAIAERHNDVFAARRPPRPSDDDDDEIHASGPGPRRPPRLALRSVERDLVVLVPSTAHVEAIADGARLVFTAAPPEREALRFEVQSEARAIEDACGWPE